MKNHLLIIISLFVFSCASRNEDGHVSEIDFVDDNPHLPGFNAAKSDPEAVVIADNVMAAMGGRKAWDETRYIAWTFFGKRHLVWDKHTGDVRIEFQDREEKYLVNIHSMKGQVLKDGKLMTDFDSLASYLSKARSIWINDSYWLVMPFKLKDTGVSLYFTGTDTTESGLEAYKLQLVFKGIGDTPDNIYDVWVDVESNFVTQWAYYESSDRVTPDIITPWENYQKHGNIMLSGGRGKAKLTNIEVLDKVPLSLFSSF